MLRKNQNNKNYKKRAKPASDAGTEASASAAMATSAPASKQARKRQKKRSRKAAEKRGRPIASVVAESDSDDQWTNGAARNTVRSPSLHAVAEALCKLLVGCLEHTQPADIHTSFAVATTSLQDPWSDAEDEAECTRRNASSRPPATDAGDKDEADSAEITELEPVTTTANGDTVAPEVSAGDNDAADPAEVAEIEPVTTTAVEDTVAAEVSAGDCDDSASGSSSSDDDNTHEVVTALTLPLCRFISRHRLSFLCFLLSFFFFSPFLSVPFRCFLVLISIRTIRAALAVRRLQRYWTPTDPWCAARSLDDTGCAGRPAT